MLSRQGVAYTKVDASTADTVFSLGTCGLFRLLFAPMIAKRNVQDWEGIDSHSTNYYQLKTSLSSLVLLRNNNNNNNNNMKKKKKEKRETEDEVVVVVRTPNTTTTILYSLNK